MNRLLVYRLILPLLAWLTVYFSSIQSMVSVWAHSKTYEHGFIIVPISLWLVWRLKDQLKHIPIMTSWLPLVLLIIPGIFWMLGKAADVALFEHIAVISSLQLILWALLGTPLAKVLFFPIFYLVFCIPFGEELIPYLQTITADITVFALKLSNIPVYREGIYLAIPNGLFEVAEACSGIRFLISSLALGTLFAYLHFRHWWKIAIFIAFSFIFPVIANGIRAFGIVLIGHLSDMKYATGADHLIYGWVFFSCVIGVIFFVASKFSDKQDVISNSNLQANQHRITTSGKLTIQIAAIALFFAYQWSWQQSLNNPAELIEQPITLPKQLVEISSSPWGINFPHAQQSVLSETKDRLTQVYIAKSYYSNDENELISYDNHLFDKDNWSLISNSRVNLGSSGNANVAKIVSQQGANRTMMYWYCINEHCNASRAKTKLLKGFYVMTRQPVTTTFTAILVNHDDALQVEKLITRLNTTANNKAP